MTTRRTFLASASAALTAGALGLRAQGAQAKATSPSAVRWIAAVPQGDGSGLTAANAAPMTSLAALATTVGPGGSILLLATDPFVLPTDGTHPILRSGGSPQAPLTIRGAAADGSEAVAEIRSDRANPWQMGGNPGAAWLELAAGTRQVVVRGLRFVDVARPIFATASVPGLTLQSIEANNVDQLLDGNMPSPLRTTLPLGSFPKLRISGVVANGFTSPLIQVRGVTAGIIENVVADAAQLETDFVKGIAFVGLDPDSASNGVLVRNCDLRGLHGLSGKYLQGDGITSEGYDRNINVEDCTISDCFDGGIDLKSAGSACRRVTVTGAKRSFRFHAPSTEPSSRLLLEDCRSIDPVFPGGNGRADHIQATGSMLFRNCSFVDHDPDMQLVEVNDGAVVKFDGGTVSHPGPLLVDDHDGVVKGVNTLQSVPAPAPQQNG